MEWLLNMPGNGQDILDTQVTVKAENWFAALRAGLNRYGVPPLSNVSCVPSSDGALEVRDFVSGRVFQILPVSTDAANTSPNASVELFGGRDVPADEGGVAYCERRICVPPHMSVAQCEAIGKDVLRAHVKPVAGCQLVVAVQVYDHAFTQQPKRPAIVRLAWQQWRPEVLKVDYPRAGRVSESPEEADFFLHSNSQTLEMSGKADPFDVMQLCHMPRTAEASEKAAASTVSPLERSEIVRPVKNVRQAERTKGKKSARQRVIDGVDDGVMWAFEQMQHMYRLKEHDEAAAFVCKTLLTAIPSEAGAVLLTTPGKSELYVAAQQGFAGDSLKTVRIPMLGGIVGAALRGGTVLNLTDSADVRFDSRVDLQGPFEVDTVLVAPISFEGHVFGVALLYNRMNDALFSQEDANVASYVAGGFAEFIQVSLPSREAEFQDREFDDLRKPKVVLGRTQGHKKGILKKKTNGARKKTPAGANRTAHAAGKKTPLKEKASSLTPSNPSSAPQIPDGSSKTVKSAKRTAADTAIKK